MGEIADLMINGDICEGCGVELDGSGDGYPRRCRGCERDSRSEYADQQAPPPRADKTNCPTCRKRVKVAGLADHLRDKHGVK